MMNSTPLLTARLLAKYFIDIIGRTNAYSEENTMHVGALACDHLLEKPLVKILTDQLKAIHSGLTIKVIRHKGLSQPIYGASDFNKKAKVLSIIINGELNYCWQKFTLIKELCHIYCMYSSDTLDGVTFRPDGNYRESLESVYAETKSFIEWNDLSSNYNYVYEELFVILLTMELVIPIYDRKRIVDLVNKIGVPPLNLKTHDVAKALLVPELMLRKYIDLKLFETPPFYEDFAH